MFSLNFLTINMFSHAIITNWWTSIQCLLTSIERLKLTPPLIWPFVKISYVSFSARDLAMWRTLSSSRRRSDSLTDGHLACRQQLMPLITAWWGLACGLLKRKKRLGDHRKNGTNGLAGFWDWDFEFWYRILILIYWINQSHQGTCYLASLCLADSFLIIIASWFEMKCISFLCYLSWIQLGWSRTDLPEHNNYFHSPTLAWSVDVFPRLASSNKLLVFLELSVSGGCYRKLCKVPTPDFMSKFIQASVM